MVLVLLLLVQSLIWAQEKSTLEMRDIPVIYHYTDAAGLLGIVEARGIWATNVWFMNDTGEATYGWERIERFLRSREANLEGERELVALTLNALRGLKNRDDFPETYIACFSKNGDQLSQWRAYGGNNGYSIGFDREGLDELASMVQPDGLPHVREVAYEETLQDAMLDSHYVREVTGVLSKEGVTEDERTAAAGSFLFWANATIPSLKHPAFSEEAEVRLQFYFEKDADEICFRDSTMGVTPYIRMPLNKSETDSISVIREVMVGPQKHSAEARRAVQHLLARNGPECRSQTVGAPLGL